MSSSGQDDPFLQVQADVESSLTQARSLFSSYLRIRALSTSTTSPELVQARTELLDVLADLSSDLSDLAESVNAAESDPYRFGLDVVEIGRRKGFVREANAEIGNMREEISGDTGKQQKQGITGTADLSNSHPIAGSNEGEDGDAFAQYEREQQLEIMRQQDEQVEDVSRTVGILQAQAADMGRELEDQTEMLEETNALAIRVEGKLQGGIKRVGHIIKRNEETASSCCIGILIAVLILLLILVIVL